MKITRYAMMLAAATGLLSACQKLDEVKAYDPDKVVAPVLHALPGEIVITPDNMGSTQTFTWDAADFGVRTQINYSIEASYNDGAKLVLFTGMNGTSSEQTYESLNNILALSVEDGGLGVPSGEPTDVDFYISATIGSAFKVSADKVNAVIAEAGTYDYWLLPEAGRAYVMAAGAKPELVADTWGLVGNITGWGDLGDFSMSEEGAYLVRKGVALTTASEFKIRFNNAWDDSKNYGTASGGAVDINKAVDIITSGGSQNMKVQLDGTYDIYFDLANSQIYIMSEGKTPAEAE